MPGWLRLVAVQWRLAVVLLGPLLLLPLPLIAGSMESRCGYVMLLVALFWMTEAVPLAISSLLPVVLLPLLGVLSTRDTCLVYMNQTNMMFFGGITIALAVEYCRLHERIALFVILKIGHSPRRLLVGFMVTTMLLSMWISNTAATAMMIPIVDAVICELKKSSECLEVEQRSSRRPMFDLPPTDSTAALQDHFPGDVSSADLQLEQFPKDASPTPGGARVRTEHEQLRNTALLATAYASNLGGTSTITGTNPNLVLSGYLSSTYGPKTGLNYATWMLFAVPTMLLATLVVALAMLAQTVQWSELFSRLKRKGSQTPPSSKYTTKSDGEASPPPPLQEEASERQKEAVRVLLVQRYDALGKLSFHELAVAVTFVVLVVLWFTRSPQFMPGWGELFDVGEVVMVGGATPALLAVFVLFVLPARPQTLLQDRYQPAGGLLTWQVVRDRFPWEVLLIMGAGFALARGASTSGLSLWISEQMRLFSSLPSEAAVFLISLLTATMTEVMSNTAVISILLPVLKELAVILDVNPLYLMIPATLSSSYAFMLPVATPPNALVFSASTLCTTDMMRIGFFLNLLCLLVLTLSINTLGGLVFDLHTFPAWANVTGSN